MKQLLLLLCLMCTFDAYACGTETTPCERPQSIGAIRSITIVQTWTRATLDDANINCRKYPLNTSIVRSYLRRAGAISADDMHHIVSYSPCRARGALVVANGRRASWEIGILGEGEISWKEGPSTYLYCSKCGHPFIH